MVKAWNLAVNSCYTISLSISDSDCVKYVQVSLGWRVCVCRHYVELPFTEYLNMFIIHLLTKFHVLHSDHCSLSPTLKLNTDSEIQSSLLFRSCAFLTSVALKWFSIYPALSGTSSTPTSDIRTVPMFISFVVRVQFNRGLSVV
jgi:hypothetical protein